MVLRVLSTEAWMSRIWIVISMLSLDINFMQPQEQAYYTARRNGWTRWFHIRVAEK